MAGGYGKEGIYCYCCKNKTTEFDVTHNGCEITVNAMKYPFCGNCYKRKDSILIKSIKERMKY